MILEEKGLVERTPHRGDRRKSVIAVTEAGSSLIRTDRDRRAAWLNRALLALSPEEQEILRAATPVIERIAEFPA